MNVTDKIAIVTGGGRGIGRAISLVLARNGADIVVADINLQDAKAVAEEVSATGRRSLATAVDVTDQGSVDHMVRHTLSQFERIDILVNNAGVIAATGWEERDAPNEADWEILYAVNVRGVARVTHAVVPHMKERRYGKIVNIASIAGRQGSLLNPPYGVSKAGVINLTQTTALLLAPYSINVNAICPGLLWTPMWERLAVRGSRLSQGTENLSPREIFNRNIEERIPMKREQVPEDIGNAAAFLASDYARNITGQAINVSGGSHLN